MRVELSLTGQTMNEREFRETPFKKPYLELSRKLMKEDFTLY